MAPRESFSFPWLKLSFRGHHFESINSMNENSLRTLKMFHKNALMACFDVWRKRWQQYIAVGGDHFEGESISFDNKLLPAILRQHSGYLLITLVYFIPARVFITLKNLLLSS